MPYKDIEKRRLRNRENGKQKVKTPCCICGKDAFVRKDTLYKYKNITCSSTCKSVLISRSNLTKIDELQFIEEYQKQNCGYQTLCQKYHIAGNRGLDILIKNNIKISNGVGIRKEMFHKEIGGWLRSENRVCKKCNKIFKFRKGSTVGYFCSHLCYMQYSGRTSIEEKMAKTLTEINIKYEEQFKIKRKYYDFYLPEYCTLIECDGTYWHSLDNNKNNDIVKNELAKKTGYTLLRFTENEINNNLEYIKQILCSLK
jgi:very-short-patch-repair endonuclease